ncbi:hypothetical protein [Streptomyces sp. NPDC086787]|uniref:hypothetical protein n=1 Tax=Streptomyces sp. NPDC086787 TaxID=3365759 RepID=UPI0038300FF6
MGIESDQVVYEYLSRVGDVAQQRQLPSAARMRLVSELRNEIDRHRARVSVDSPAAVRRIIARLGSPDEVVAAAGSEAGGSASVPSATVPVQPVKPVKHVKPVRPESPARPRWRVPKPRPAEPEVSSPAPSPPHLAGEDELGDSALQPDWWRVDSSPFGEGDSVPGFVGGVEIPELLRPPPPKKEPGEAAESGEPGELTEAEESEAAAAEEAAPRRRRFAVPGPAAGWTNPLLLLAAGLLVAGAVLGNWLALALGWLIAYGSRRLTPAETRWAVMVLPALAVTAGVVWLWGRTDGRWGAPLAQGHMNDAVGETWPWVVRGAALASALYLAWRSQRRR